MGVVVTTIFNKHDRDYEVRGQTYKVKTTRCDLFSTEGCLGPSKSVNITFMNITDQGHVNFQRTKD
jgi:hypothetical protein